MGWEQAIGLEDAERLLKRKLIKRPKREVLAADVERPAFECNCLIHSKAGGSKAKRDALRAAGGGEHV